MLLATVLMATALTAGAPEVPPGTPIVAIRIVRHDIFDTDDPETSSWPYRWANALHVLTREQFIRSMLLFRVGDKLDPALLEESARLLRFTEFLSPVNITTHPAPGGAEVVVETHDQWTTLVGVSFGLFGKRVHFGAALSEENLLGWGKELDLEFDRDQERTITTFKYKDPLFLGSRWSLMLAHANASDGKSDAFRLEYPFFALATPRSGGVGWGKFNLTDYLYSEGNQVVSGLAHQQDFDLWGGLRLPGGGEGANRVTAGVFYHDVSYDDWRWSDGRPYPTPEGRKMSGPQVGFERQSGRWVVARGFRGWQAQEDLPLGPNWSATAGFSLPVFGADEPRFPLLGQVNASFLSGKQFSWVNLAAEGRAEQGRVDNAITHFAIGTARLGPVGFRGRLAVDLGHNLDGNVQLPLGADTGLRGWEPDYFDGTSRAVANLEWRHQLTGEVLHIAIIGVSLFADVGRTWNPRVGPSTDGWRKDVGIGLLIESTRASRLRIVRIEAGWPDRGKGPLILITGAPIF
jgi:hypothetical protein